MEPPGPSIIGCRRRVEAKRVELAEGTSDFFALARCCRSRQRTWAPRAKTPRVYHRFLGSRHQASKSSPARGRLPRSTTVRLADWNLVDITWASSPTNSACLPQIAIQKASN